MKLRGYEMETIILYNQAEPTAQVYTHDPKLIAKLRRLHEASPEKVYGDCMCHFEVHLLNPCFQFCAVHAVMRAENVVHDIFFRNQI